MAGDSGSCLSLSGKLMTPTSPLISHNHLCVIPYDEAVMIYAIIWLKVLIDFSREENEVDEESTATKYYSCKYTSLEPACTKYIHNYIHNPNMIFETSKSVGVLWEVEIL